MRGRVLGWLMLLAWAHTAVAAPETAPSRVFEGRDIFDLQWVEDPQIRPDGHAVAYVRMSYDIMSDRATIDSLARGPRYRNADTAGERTRIACLAALVTGRKAPRLRLERRRGPPQLFVRWMQTRTGGADHGPDRAAGRSRLVPGRALDCVHHAHSR